jgi:hypothetical protein
VACSLQSACADKTSQLLQLLLLLSVADATRTLQVHQTLVQLLCQTQLLVLLLLLLGSL